MAQEYVPENYGAVGDGRTDDSAAIQNLVNSMPYDATLRLRSLYHLANPLIVSTPISIQGGGAKTGFIVAHPSPGHAAVVIGRENENVIDSRTYRDFGIYGKNGSCRYALAIFRANRSVFQNIYMRPGSTENAVIIAGCQGSRFELIVSTNSSQAAIPDLDALGLLVPAGTGNLPGGWKGAGILVSYLGDAGIGNYEPTAACQFDCIVEGGGEGAGGIAVRKQSTAGPTGIIYLQGTNQIRGLYQGFSAPPAEQAGELFGAGYPIRIDQCDGFTIHSVHAETAGRGVRITGSQRFAVRDSLITSGAGSTGFRIEGSSDFTLDRLYVTALSITASQHYRTVGVMDESGARYG